MAIQNRRGVYKDFDPSKLLPGEWAVVTSGDTKSNDGSSVYVCMKTGNVKRMSTYEDMMSEVTTMKNDVKSELTQDMSQVKDQAFQAALNANREAGQAVNAAKSASDATALANAAAKLANTAAEKANNAVKTVEAKTYSVRWLPTVTGYVDYEYSRLNVVQIGAMVHVYGTINTLAGTSPDVFADGLPVPKNFNTPLIGVNMSRNCSSIICYVTSDGSLQFGIQEATTYFVTGCYETYV